MSTHRYLMEGADGGYGISIVSSSHFSLKNRDHLNKFCTQMPTTHRSHNYKSKHKEWVGWVLHMHGGRKQIFKKVFSTRTLSVVGRLCLFSNFYNLQRFIHKNRLARHQLPQARIHVIQLINFIVFPSGTRRRKPKLNCGAVIIT